MADMSEAPPACAFSIIVPVLNEADSINSLLEHVSHLKADRPFEVIVVDGDRRADTVSAIRHEAVVSLVSDAGRARQMNAGAAIARGGILIFLHADTELPTGALSRIGHALEDGTCVAGAFDLGIESDRFALKLIAKVASLRSRITRIPYGDQAIFVRKTYFNDIGGYKDIPLLEDAELMHRIKKRGDRICILSDPVNTSPRRWEREGALYCTLRNCAVAALYFMGISPHRLARFYKAHPGTDKESC